MYTNYSIGYREITENDLRTDKTPIIQEILEEDVERLRLLFDDGIEYIFEDKGRRILERKLTEDEINSEIKQMEEECSVISQWLNERKK